MFAVGVEKHEEGEERQFVVQQKLCAAACVQVRCNFQAALERSVCQCFITLECSN